MRTIEKKIENVWLPFVGGVARFEILLPWGPMLMKKENREKWEKAFFVSKFKNFPMCMAQGSH